MHNFFIKEKYLNELLSIFDKYCPKAEIMAYGSRVGGDCHEGSDLDLAIKNLDGIYLFELKEILRNSDIPFLIDIVEFEKVPESFQKEILRKNITIYPKM
ncbi:nucleotidyltransferase domain-containing protein [bacterium]|nr:nucleotidyltransferase domain-containing protein [bacterium]